MLPASGWCSHRIEVRREVQGLRNDLLQGKLDVLHPGNVSEHHIYLVAVDNISRHLVGCARTVIPYFTQQFTKSPSFPPRESTLIEFDLNLTLMILGSKMS